MRFSTSTLAGDEFVPWFAAVGRRTGVLSGFAAGEGLLLSVFLGPSGDLPHGFEPEPAFLVRKPVEGLLGSAPSLRLLEHC